MIRIHSCHLWERSLHLEPGTGWFRTDDGRLDAILNLDVMNCLLNKAGLNFSSLKKAEKLRRQDVEMSGTQLMWSVHKPAWAMAKQAPGSSACNLPFTAAYFHPRHIPDKGRWTQIHRNGNPLATVVLHRRSSKVPLSCLESTAMPSGRSTNRPRVPGRRAIGARYVAIELVRNLAEGPSLPFLSNGLEK
jgi:hypothetical protein